MSTVSIASSLAATATSALVSATASSTTAVASATAAAVAHIKLTPVEALNVAKVAIVVGCLSVFGSLYIMISFFFLKKPPLTTIIVFIMACLDFVSATFIVTMSSLKVAGRLDMFWQENWNNPKTRHGTAALCQFQGWVQMFFYSAVNYWTLVFAIQVYLQIVRNSSILNFHRGFLLANIVVWSVALFLSIVPFWGTSFAYYEDSGAVCFISTTKPDARQVLFYMIVYAILIVIAILYTLVLRHILTVRGQTKQLKSTADSKWGLFNKIGIYPIIFMIIWIPNSLNRGYEFATGNQSYSFTMIQTILLPAQGFLNFLVYGISSGRFAFFKTIGSLISSSFTHRISASQHSNASSDSHKGSNHKSPNSGTADISGDNDDWDQ